MSLLAPLGGLALLAIPVIVGLYLLKRRRPEIPSATLRLWRGDSVMEQANRPWQRLRHNRLLLVQVLVALLLGLALMRPAFNVNANSAPGTVIVLDASASMLAQDVKPDRFQAAVQQARDIIRTRLSGQEVGLVLAGEHARLLATPTSDAALLQKALSTAQVSGSTANLGEALSLADSLLAGRQKASIVLIGDGHAAASEKPRVSAGFSFVQVGESGDNTAIEAMTQTPGGNVYIRVANYSQQRRDLKIEMRADGTLVDTIPISVDGNARTETTWTNLPAEVNVLEARITPGDLFPIDDRAWLTFGAPTSHRVLLVSHQETFLRRALELRSDLDVTVVDPADYTPPDNSNPSELPYDLFVFDGFIPPGTLPTPALIVDPPTNSRSVPAGALVDPGAVLPVDSHEPLLQGVSVTDVHVQAAEQVRPANGWRTVVASSIVPLVLIHEDSPAMAEFTFDLQRSDLPLRAAFPVLVQNLVARILPEGYDGQTLSPGQTVRIVPGPSPTEVQVVRPDDQVVELQPPYPKTFSDTTQVGAYHVKESLSGRPREGWFVVEMQHPSESQIAPKPAPAVEKVAGVVTAPDQGRVELWPWLAFAALGLLAAELVLARRA
jgi:hypothetical protein